MEHQTLAGSVVEPASSPNALAVGAYCWTGNATEYYSSMGPTISGLTKPDIAGPDSNSSPIFGNFSTCGFSGFYGTSSAAPHVAGAAALVLQANPSFTAAQIQAFLEGRAVDLGFTGKDNEWGSGQLALAGTVYRLQHSVNGYFFYTAIPAERDYAISIGFLLQGPCCAWYLTQVAGSTPLYRLNKGEHMFTISAAERDSAVANYGYTYEGIAGYCFNPASAPVGSWPWYRLSNNAIHLHTLSEVERANAIAYYGFHDESVTCNILLP